MRLWIYFGFYVLIVVAVFFYCNNFAAAVAIIVVVVGYFEYVDFAVFAAGAVHILFVDCVPTVAEFAVVVVVVFIDDVVVVVFDLR